MAQRSYTLINLVGLTVGFTAVIMIGLFVIDQLSFDRHLADHHRMFRPVQIQNEPGVGEQHVAVTMGPLAATMKAQIPGVTDAVRLMPCWNLNLMSGGSLHSDSTATPKMHKVRDFWYADSNALSFFGFSLLEGDPLRALVDPFSVILTEKQALRLFNRTENVVGEMVTVDGRGYSVTGLLKEPEGKSHLVIEAMVSFSSLHNNPDYAFLKGWGNNSLATYVKLASPDGQAAAEEAIQTELKKMYKEQNNDESPVQFYLQPMDEVYLHSDHIKFQITSRKGNATTVYLFLIVGILVLITACVNFINMSLARAVKRSKEVGVRKVLGAMSADLFRQFLGEAVLFSVISAGLSLMFAELFLSSFNEMLFTELTLFGNAWLFPLLASVVVLVSLISGGYPAFYLARFEPAVVLKGAGNSRGKSSGWLSRSLIVFQYAVTTAMVFMVIVSWSQYRFAVKRDLGINYQGVMALHHRMPHAQRFIPQIKARLLENPNISAVSAAADFNGAAGSQGPVTIDDSAKSRLMVRFCFVDEDFFPAMGVPIVEGRNFSRAFPLDSSQSVIMNQAAVNALGWKNPVGMRFRSFSDDSTQRPVVVGVIRDYNYFSIHWKIEPAIFLLRLDRTGTILIKLKDSAHDTLVGSSVKAHIETVWNEFFPTAPFEPHYATELTKQWYSNENRTMELFLFFALLSIIISCLGLYGLSSLMMEQRIREIGIRRVMGGSYWNISRILLVQYLRLVFLGGLVAAPVAWILADNLLGEFAYQVGLSPLLLLVAVVVTLVVALVTIGQRIYSASRTNPVEALKYE